MNRTRPLVGAGLLAIQAVRFDRTPRRYHRQKAGSHQSVLHRYVAAYPRLCRSWLAGDEALEVCIVSEVAIASKPAPTQTV